MPPLSRRARRAIKAYGVTELYLMDHPVAYYAVTDTCLGIKVYGRKVGTVQQHYSAPGPSCSFTPQALGLTDPLPEIWCAPTDKAPPVYSGLAAIRKDDGIFAVPGGEYWSNGRILVYGPVPDGRIVETPGCVTTDKIKGMVGSLVIPTLPNLQTAYRIGDFLYYKIEGRYFQTGLIDLLIRNAERGKILTFMASTGGQYVGLYVGGFFVGLVMAMSPNCRVRSTEPHNPPKQSGALPWT